MAARSKSSRSADILNKKVPENPKYKDVKSVLDTGASMSKYMAKMEDIRKNYRYRKGELFKRMKVTTFVQLVLQVQSVNRNEDDGFAFSDTPSQDGQDTSREVHKNGSGDVANSPVPSLALTEGDYGESQDILSARSTLQSVIRGVGECDLTDDNSPDTPKLPSTANRDIDCPYLLLDLRDNDDYQKCHIISAKNYPTAMLSRSCNNYTKDMMSYRNQPGKIIVMYDEDERIGPMAASTLAQRGFDNTFLLSGGLKVASQRFPSGLVTGTLPLSCKPSPPSTARKTARKSTDEPIVPADKMDFTEDDILLMKGCVCLEFLLNEALVPSDTGSRLSRATTRANTNMSNATIMTNRSTASSMSGMPWK
ncbi:centrosomal protein of 41 kDa A-like [Amphiura filiformis]|uniref:centrosomal protein of 41 kDa A-like n=1 Tax=Amphiura filiformis TaxID=82378 RepID=UPI003B20D2A1